MIKYPIKVDNYRIHNSQFVGLFYDLVFKEDIGYVPVVGLKSRYEDFDLVRGVSIAMGGIWVPAKSRYRDYKTIKKNDRFWAFEIADPSIMTMVDKSIEIWSDLQDVLTINGNLYFSVMGNPKPLYEYFKNRKKVG